MDYLQTKSNHTSCVAQSTSKMENTSECYKKTSKYYLNSTQITLNVSLNKLLNQFVPATPAHQECFVTPSKWFHALLILQSLISRRGAKTNQTLNTTCIVLEGMHLACSSISLALNKSVYLSSAWTNLFITQPIPPTTLFKQVTTTVMSSESPWSEIRIQRLWLHLQLNCQFSLRSEILGTCQMLISRL